MTKSVKITIAVLLLLCVIIAVFPLMSIKDSEFGGADGAAEEAISEIDPGMSHGQKASSNHPAAKPKACCSACRQRSAPVFCSSALVIWLPERNIKRISSASFGRRETSPLKKAGPLSPLFRLF